MALANTARPEDLPRDRSTSTRWVDGTHPPATAVSWAAVIAGAAAAAIGVSTIVWLTLTQLLASAMGGYLAGRLRTRWLDLHTDEVYFRDTAHGFLAWAVASLATAAKLTSVIGCPRTSATSASWSPSARACRSRMRRPA